MANEIRPLRLTLPSLGLHLAVGLLSACSVLMAHANARDSRPVVEVDLAPWQPYLVSEITPKLEQLESVAVPNRSWVALDQTLLAPEFAKHWVRRSEVSAASPIRLAFIEPRWGLDHPPMTLVRSARSRVEQSMMMPGVTTQVTDNSALTVSAVLASQRFVNPGMNLMAYEGAIPAGAEEDAVMGQRIESSHGVGLRVAHQFEPMDTVVIETAYQSRIDMNPLATMQGVHGAAAQLDIPSRFETRLGWQITDRVIGSIGYSHIFYSEVGAFPSRAMPARFSALLGDSTSPEFAWRDLGVMTAGIAVQLTESLSAEVEYKNRAQPKPTARALAEALGGELNKHAWRVGMTQMVSERGRFHISAAYAPPEYVFGGHVLGVVSDDLKQGLEMQALWQWFF